MTDRIRHLIISLVISLAPAAVLLLAACGSDGGGGGPDPKRLTVVRGTAGGTGTVVSAPAGIDCTIGAGAATGTCAADFASGTVVKLSSTPSGGSTFGSWTGACGASANAPACAVNVTVDLSVTATFLPPGSVFGGFAALAAPASGSAIVVVSIPTAVFSIGRPRAGGTPFLSLHSSPLFASGTVRMVGDTAIASVSGTFDPSDESRRLCLVQVPPGATDPCRPPAGAWSFDGFLNGVSVVSGTFQAPQGVGTMRMLSSVSAEPPALFCGTLTPTGAGAAPGPLNVALAGGRLTGQGALATGAFEVDGSLNGSAVTLIGSDGLFTASGQLNAAGTALSGTWTQPDLNGGGISGNWSASTDCR